MLFTQSNNGPFAVDGGGISTITTPQTIAPNDTRLRYYGGAVGPAPAPNAAYYALSTLSAPIPGSLNTSPWAVEFGFYGQKYEFVVLGAGAGQNASPPAPAGTYRLYANGQRHAGTQVGGPQIATDGLVHYMGVDFGSVAQRRIRIESQGPGLLFGGIRIGKLDTLLIDDSHPLRILYLGDSYTDSGSATMDGWAVQSALRLGFKDIYIRGTGGSGYLAGAQFRSRLADITGANPNVIVVAGGINDHAMVKATIQAEALYVFQQILIGLPSLNPARLIVLGPFCPFTPDSTYTDTRDAIKTSALAVGASFIDNIAESWIFGTGHEGLLHNDGNADLFISTDGTHPNQLGHTYLGTRVAAALAKLL